MDWELDFEKRFDLVSSSGLNIYIQDPRKTVALNQRFHKMLKPGGVLLTSFMTPPPWISQRSVWAMDQIDAEALRRQRMIYGEILGFKGSSYRTESEVLGELRQAGFSSFSVHYDRARIFPTAWAER